MTIPDNIYDYILQEEENFNLPINLNGWQWSMKEHIKTGFYYKHGRLLNGNDPDVPVKNIIRRILHLQYRAEDIDVKDIMIYVDDKEARHLSFLIKKYHDDVFTQKNDLDTFFDDLKESKIDYGLGIAKRVEGVKPYVIPLESIAFCDQTDILAGPIAFKYNYSPSELSSMSEKGWENIDQLIALAKFEKVFDKATGVVISTPGKKIEVYEVYGDMPKKYFDEKDNTEKFSYQMQIVGFYRDEKSQKRGITLFKKEIKNGNLKVSLRDKVYSRACGFGGIEELVEDQAWTNFSTQIKKEFLEAASKVVLLTDNGDLAAKHPTGLRNLEQLELLEVERGTKGVWQADTIPRAINLFDRFEAELESHAQQTGFANDSLLGESPVSGTPFRLNERVVMEGKGTHEYRKGKFAKDIELIYKDWLIPDMIDEISNGAKFLSTLTYSEMQYVADCVVNNMLAEYQKELILNGELPLMGQEEEAYKQKVRENFFKEGNKKFIEILKGEFKNRKISIKVNVAGKQKNLALMADKITNIWRMIFSNPQGFIRVMALPGMAESFNKLLEYSDLSVADFAQLANYNPQSASPVPQAETGAMIPEAQPLSVNNLVNG